MTGKYSQASPLSPTLSAGEFKAWRIPSLQIISRLINTIAYGRIQDETKPFASVEGRK